MAPWQAARWAAFCARQPADIFACVAGQHSIWGADPYDEETIHNEAREVFSDCLETAADGPSGRVNRGRILLLRGDAGAGKTHLMGAFRREVERRGAGYFTYAQMSTGMADFWKYLLVHVVESLQQPGGEGRPSAWMRLSHALVERSCVPAEERETLRKADDYANAALDIRGRLLDDLKTGDPARQVHGDFLQVLILLQREDGNTFNAAMKYLRGDHLQDVERQWLCFTAPLSGTGDPAQLLEWVLRAVSHYGGIAGQAFVLCLDQLEEMFEYEKGSSQQKFPELISALCTLTDRHPSLIAVLACLDDFYAFARSALLKPHRDRLELEAPAPVLLRSDVDSEEVVALVKRRLECLEGDPGEPEPAGNPVFPFRMEEVLALVGWKPRAVLSTCGAAWLRSRRTGELPVFGGETPPIGETTKASTDWPRRWNDFRAAWAGSVPAAYAELAHSLAETARAFAAQSGLSVAAEERGDNLLLRVGETHWFLGFCHKGAQGGGLARELEALVKEAAAAGQPALVVRGTEFPKDPKGAAAKVRAKIIGAGGRGVIIPEADWRAFLAWAEFSATHAQNLEFQAWQQADRPLAAFPSLRELLHSEEIDQPEQPPVTPPVSIDPEPSLDPARIPLGVQAGARETPLDLETAALLQHAAVLGGTGSGKTTLAMAVIEHLVLRGIPAILVDRKGDLARYADPEALNALGGPLGELFRQKVDVALFTPGNADGRPLTLSILPSLPEGAGSQVRLSLAEDAAYTLAAALKLKESARDVKKKAVLIKAIQVLFELNPAPGLEELLHLMDSQDEALLQALNYLDPRLLADLVQELDGFRAVNSRVLAPGAEPLRAEFLLGLGEHAVPGRTRLCVISTKFVGDDALAQFWVAQLMMELARYASARPTPHLQALVMLDEADLYLPAGSKPASKQPLENALRRFRSQGIGVMLATQSPGDLDYRCRENIQTWLVGRVKESRALEKLRPVFGQDGATHLEKLGQHATGEFCLVRAETLRRFKGERNLLKTEQISDAQILATARPPLPPAS
jgi:hypothetical protein